MAAAAPDHHRGTKCAHLKKQWAALSDADTAGRDGRLWPTMAESAGSARKRIASSSTMNSRDKATFGFLLTTYARRVHCTPSPVAPRHYLPPA